MAKGLNMSRHPKEKSEGRVVDAITGDPIEGVRVTLPDGRYGFTGTDGRVTVWHKSREKDVAKVWEVLGLSRDEYMILYWDFPNKKVMAIDHLGHHSPVGDIYDIATDDGHVVSFKIKEAT